MKRILVVDDSDLILLLYRGIFNNHPEIKVDTESVSKNVPSRLKTNCYDLIIIDLIMPEMDGFQLLRKIQKFPGIERIHFYISSGVQDLEMNEQVMELGVKGIIKKPVNKEEVLELVNRVLFCQEV